MSMDFLNESTVAASRMRGESRFHSFKASGKKKNL